MEDIIMTKKSLQLIADILETIPKKTGKLHYLPKCRRYDELLKKNNDTTYKNYFSRIHCADNDDLYNDEIDNMRDNKRYSINK